LLDLSDRGEEDGGGSLWGFTSFFVQWRKPHKSAPFNEREAIRRKFRKSYKNSVTSVLERRGGIGSISDLISSHLEQSVVDVTIEFSIGHRGGLGR
jgi:hypothetical protein